MAKVTCRVEKVNIPTYEIGEYDKNPMFLEKRVYQGSSGRVYPHPVCEGVADVKNDHEYTAIYLENDYILVMLLPELGGRVQRLYDKTNGYDAVYYNEVVKPALVGLVGPWISGGIEFNWPQHHRPSTFDPVEYRIEEQEDGSVTVWTGEIEKMFHTKGLAGFTVYPDKAYLEIKGQIYNPTNRPQTFLWWANPAVAVNDNTQSVFPPDVNAVMDHGKRDVSTFPIATGTYYKVDYSKGVDISRYKNIPVPTSYMAHHSDYDFIGNYDHGKRAGLLHVADHHVSPGKKQWTWGNGDFGKAWDRNLTDENGPYIELMTGMFTDNQPDFTYLKPYEEKNFVQYFMPYKEVGAVKNASTLAALNLEVIEKYIQPQVLKAVENSLQEDTRNRIGTRSIVCSVYAASVLENVTLTVWEANEKVFETDLTLLPTETFSHSIVYSGDVEKLCLTIKKDKRVLLSCKAVEQNNEPIPEPAKPAKRPEEMETCEKLFLTATHLEQYRHATYSPEPYYLEGLRRDASDIRLNLGYGKYLMNKGLYKESIPYLKQAVSSSTWKNPNPYDCEPYFYLGMAYKETEDYDKAFDAFYKAAWDEAQQSKAFYQLACLSSRIGEYEKAIYFTEQSLIRGWHNLKARNLKTTLLRLSGRTEEANAFAQETQKIDPLDWGSGYEIWKIKCESNLELCDEEYGLHNEDQQGIKKQTCSDTADNHNLIELSLNYKEAGLYREAAAVLALSTQENDPMLHYYRYFYTDCKDAMESAERADSSFCFPNRVEDIAVLTKAIEQGALHACYYLGCLFYDKGRYEEAITLWERASEANDIPAVYRNLSLAYFNKKKDVAKAKAAIETAFTMNTKDVRVLFELDQFYKVTEVNAKERLAHLEQYAELLPLRDNLYTEYITLLNENEEYEKAYEFMMAHKFHPWEGGEGKITSQYRIALMAMAQKKAENGEIPLAEELLQKALVYPENLGEGKLIGAMDNDIYYLLGKLQTQKENADAYFEKAAKCNMEFSSAMYYNDQPPQMAYYAALAMAEAGNKKEAENVFRNMAAYGEEHMDDEVEIEYFAVSLPDFLVYEADLQKKNKLHCKNMIDLGKKGLEIIGK